MVRQQQNICVDRVNANSIYPSDKLWTKNYNTNSIYPSDDLWTKIYNVVLIHAKLVVISFKNKNLH